MTNPLFRHEVQIANYRGEWFRSAINRLHDGSFGAACVERDAALERNPRFEYRVVTVLVPPRYELQLRTNGGRWLPSAHNVINDGSWLSATRTFQQAGWGLTTHYRVVQVDA